MVAKVIEDVKVPPLALAIVVSILIIGFFAGVTVTKMQGADEVQKLQHEFALDEVSGLRSDVVKEDNHLQKQIDELKKEIKELQPK